MRTPSRATSPGRLRRATEYLPISYPPAIPHLAAISKRPIRLCAIFLFALAFYIANPYNFAGGEMRLNKGPQQTYSKGDCKMLTAELSFVWDEMAPPTATTPRGWVYLNNHADSDGKPCGWYLDYGPRLPGQDKGPNGETILASAYLYTRDDLGRSYDVRLGDGWFATIEDAKDWIEKRVLKHFGVWLLY